MASLSLPPSQSAQSLPFRVSPLAAAPAPASTPLSQPQGASAPLQAARSGVAAAAADALPASSYNPWTLLAPLMCSPPSSSAPAVARMQEHLDALTAISLAYPQWLERCEAVLLALARARVDLQRFTHLSFLHCLLVRGELTAAQLPPFDDVPSSDGAPDTLMPSQHRAYRAPFTLHSPALNPRPIVPGVPPGIWAWMRRVRLEDIERRGAAAAANQQQREQVKQEDQQEDSSARDHTLRVVAPAVPARGIPVRSTRSPRPPQAPAPPPLPLPLLSQSQDTEHSFG